MLESLSVVELRKVVLDLMEYQYLEIELPHSIRIQFLLFLAFNVFSSEHIKELLIFVFHHPVMCLQLNIPFHRFLQVVLEDLLLLFNRPRCGRELFHSAVWLLCGSASPFRSGSLCGYSDLHALNHF